MYCIMFKPVPREKNIIWVDSWNIINAGIETLEIARAEKKKFEEYIKKSKKWKEYRIKVEIANLCSKVGEV